MFAKIFRILAALVLLGLLLFTTVTYAQEPESCTFASPIEGKLPNGDFVFGEKTPWENAESDWAPGHTGEDYVYPAGTPILSVGAGDVVWIGWWPQEGASNGTGYGHSVWIRHKCGQRIIYSHYAHMAPEFTVAIGQLVGRGQRIGSIGKLGESGQAANAEHLHLGLREGGDPTMGAAMAGTWLRPSDYVTEVQVEAKIPEPPNQETQPINQADIEAYVRVFFWSAVFTGLGVIVVISLLGLKNRKVQEKAVETVESQRPWVAHNTVNFVFWVTPLVAFLFVTYAPVWIPQGQYIEVAAPVTDVEVSQWAQNARYPDAVLLQAFVVKANIARDASGEPVDPGQFGKTIPPEVPAVIPAGETTLAPWDGLYDPTKPGPYGKCLAWEEVKSRFPPTLRESLLGRENSQQAEEQYKGLLAIADMPDVKALGKKLGKEITPETIYGSCGAGALGRTQVMPVHFAPGHMMAGMSNKDVWNDPYVIAEATIRHLYQRGCWGGWYESEDSWSVWCGYNPGAWGKYPNYWDALRQTHARLVEAYPAGGVAVEVTAPSGIFRRTPTTAGFLITERWTTPSALVHISRTALTNSAAAWSTRTLKAVHDTSLLWALIAYDRESREHQGLGKEGWILSSIKK